MLYYYRSAALKSVKCSVVLIPIHFDRNPEDRPIMSFLSETLLSARTFMQPADFMTGIPATRTRDPRWTLGKTHAHSVMKVL